MHFALQSFFDTYKNHGTLQVRVPPTHPLPKRKKLELETDTNKNPITLMPIKNPITYQSRINHVARLIMLLAKGPEITCICYYTSYHIHLHTNGCCVLRSHRFAPMFVVVSVPLRKAIAPPCATRSGGPSGSGIN